MSGNTSWNLVVRAQDGGGDPTLFGTLSVLVSLVHVNHPPAIKSGLTYNVSEGVGGTLLIDLSTVITDSDANDNPVSTLNVYITSGDPLGKLICFKKTTTNNISPTTNV